MLINTIPALGTEPQRYFFNIDPILKSKFAVRCKPGYRSFAIGEREESLDSIEQCTGEEPGILTNAERQVEVTDSATENDLTPQPPLHKVERGSKV